MIRALLSRAWPAAAVVPVAVLFAGCASTLDVRTFPTEGVDFGAFRTYAWFAEPKVQVTESPFEDKLGINPLLQDLIEAELDARGWSKAERGEADLRVGYLVLIHDDTAMTVVDGYFGHEIGAPEVRLIHEAGLGDNRELESGSLVIDVVEARTDRLVWRGWVESEIDRSRTPEDRTERIREAVDRLLADFPRAGR